jgi:hypothetical protein
VIAAVRDSHSTLVAMGGLTRQRSIVGQSVQREQGHSFDSGAPAGGGLIRRDARVERVIEFRLQVTQPQ